MFLLAWLVPAYKRSEWPQDRTTHLCITPAKGGALSVSVGRERKNCNYEYTREPKETPRKVCNFIGPVVDVGRYSPGCIGRDTSDSIGWC